MSTLTVHEADRVVVVRPQVTARTHDPRRRIIRVAGGGTDLTHARVASTRVKVGQRPVTVTDDARAQRLRITTTGPRGATGPAGPPGPPGPAGAPGGTFTEYVMPTAQTTATIDHGLGRDPVAWSVLVDGAAVSEYSVVPTIPNQQIRFGFDIAVVATIRLI